MVSCHSLHCKESSPASSGFGGKRQHEMALIQREAQNEEYYRGQDHAASKKNRNNGFSCCQYPSTIEGNSSWFSSFSQLSYQLKRWAAPVIFYSQAIARWGHVHFCQVSVDERPRYGAPRVLGLAGARQHFRAFHALPSSCALAIEKGIPERTGKKKTEELGLHRDFHQSVLSVASWFCFFLLCDSSP